MNKNDRYRNELMRINNNIQFYKHKIALCQASNARMFYEKLLSKEAKRFHELQLQYEQFDLSYQQLSYHHQTKPWQSNPPGEGIPVDQVPEDYMPELENVESEDPVSAVDEMGLPLDPGAAVDEMEELEPENPDSQPDEITIPEGETTPEGQRVFTLEELSKFNGTNGQPAYVAVNGIVYDVSSVQRWAGGTHFSLFAGKDLTTNFNVCHGGIYDRLNNLPIVGILKV